ncbi:hypothetical protein AB1Y20_023564 [Prymnesium parvum]|uniref:2Fe-2S ferredoxin-type domain-containing protein n=1 Tax=Prymnesium parvum TaxID=97485 RepID=A0AB34JHF9_PRYPA
MALRATVCFLLVASASALMAVPHPRLNTGRTSVPAMGLFDALSSAFANDETLGARENAGLSKDVTKRTVTWVAPGGQTKLSTVVAGQRFRDIARSSGIPIKYDCQEGTCKTCEAMVGNSRAKLCVARMPNKDVTVKYNIRN